MKRVLSILMAAMLLFSMPVYGQDILVVEKPGINPVIGIDTEFVINRTVDLEKSGLEADYSAQYYDLYTTVVLGDNLLVVKPKAGIQTFQATVENTPIGDIDADGGIGWNIGLDAQLNAVNTDYANLALIGSYRFSRTDLDKININGAEISNPIETILYTHEWEIGAKVSKDLSEIEALQPYVGKSLTPYIGLVYSDMYGTIEANTNSIIGADIKENLRAKNKFGLRAGIAFAPADDITISVDIKFVDQVAVGASASYKF